MHSGEGTKQRDLPGHARATPRVGRGRAECYSLARRGWSRELLSVTEKSGEAQGWRAELLEGWNCCLLLGRSRLWAAGGKSSIWGTSHLNPLQDMQAEAPRSGCARMSLQLS